MKHLAIFAIRIYQGVHGVFFHGCCRFHPTCSQYAVEAIETRGLPMGMVLAAYRLLRCQPFCKGGWDPVPPAPKAGKRFRRPVPHRAIRPLLGTRRVLGIRRVYD